MTYPRTTKFTAAANERIASFPAGKRFTQFDFTDIEKEFGYPKATTNLLRKRAKNGELKVVGELSNPRGGGASKIFTINEFKEDAYLVRDPIVAMRNISNALNGMRRGL